MSNISKKETKMNRDFKRRMQEELRRYDTSIKAFLLGHDSWYMGTYIRCMRLASYYQHKSLIHMAIIGFYNKWLMRRIGRKLGFQFGIASIGLALNMGLPEFGVMGIANGILTIYTTYV